MLQSCEALCCPISEDLEHRYQQAKQGFSVGQLELAALLTSAQITQRVCGVSTNTSLSSCTADYSFWRWTTINNMTKRFLVIWCRIIEDFVTATTTLNVFWFCWSSVIINWIFLKTFFSVSGYRPNYWLMVQIIIIPLGTFLLCFRSFRSNLWSDWTISWSIEDVADRRVNVCSPSHSVCLFSQHTSVDDGRGQVSSRSVRSARCKNSSSSADETPHVGNYRLLKTIGKGNFAKVKLARHIRTGREVRQDEGWDRTRGSQEPVKYSSNCQSFCFPERWRLKSLIKPSWTPPACRRWETDQISLDQCDPVETLSLVLIKGGNRLWALEDLKL